MTSVTLTDSRFNLASDLSQSVEMVLTGESVVAGRPVDVRRYANGRVRAFTRTGVNLVFQLNFELADRSDRNTLEDWVGKTVLFRDPRGRRRWGVFDAVEDAEIPGVVDDVLNVNVQFTQTTHDESV